jgi:hypothetical protein
MRIAHCIAIRFVAMGICTHDRHRHGALYANVYCAHPAVAFESVRAIHHLLVVSARDRLRGPMGLSRIGTADTYLCRRVEEGAA